VDFSAWVRLDAEGDRDGGYILLKGKYLVRETYSIVVTDIDHYPQARVCVGGAYYIAEVTEGLIPGKWTYVQGVYDGTAGLMLNVYEFDDVQGAMGNKIGDDFVAVSGALEQNSESLYIGCDYGNPLTVWEGSIDDVSITVPEPATLSLLALGGLALIQRRRRG